MAHFLPPEHVRQVNKLEWPYIYINICIYTLMNITYVMFISDTMLVRFLKLHVPDNFIILGASADEITNR